MTDKVIKTLVPVDGSEHSDRAVEHVVRLYQSEGRMEVHVLNVQIPVDSGHARMFVSHEDIDAYYREEGQAALASARRILDGAGVPHTDHLAIGHVAQTIAEFARQKGMDKVVIGTHGRSALTHLLLGSVATDVVRECQVPVTLVK
jgi:nucleotide-binding universal stress UspA family protein